jgi:hypothetical protein
MARARRSPLNVNSISLKGFCEFTKIILQARISLNIKTACSRQSHPNNTNPTVFIFWNNLLSSYQL